MKAFIICAILLVSAFAVQDEAIATIEKLQNSKFGKQLFDTIALQIQAGDPADDLIHMLQDQEDQLQDEQDVDDEYILTLENVCVDDLAKLVDEIEASRTKIQELEDLLKELEPLKAKKEEERANLEDYKALLQTKLAEMAAAKELKDAEWAEEKEQHDSQTAIISKAKDIIVGGFSANFLESKAQAQTQVLAQVSQHFAQAKKTHFKTKGINSIFRVLAQVSASQEVQAAQSSIQKIIDLCDQLLEKIAESRAIEKQDYDHWMAEYTQTHDTLQASLEDTIAKIAQLTLEINILTKKINAAHSSLDEETIRLGQKIAQHDERELFCDEAGKKYANDRAARSDELDIISDAIGLLMAKIRVLKQYVSDSVDTLVKPMF